MIPTHLLPNLPPSAAKIYLVLLHLQTRPNAPIPASLDHLSKLSGFCIATCKTALNHLISLQLLTRLPRKYHLPNTYRFPEPSNSQPASPYPPTNSQPAGSYPPTNSHPAGSFIPQRTPPTPVPASKTQMSQPASSLLIQMLPLLTNPADSCSPDAIRALYNQLTPDEKQLAIAVAKSTLQRTAPQELHA